MGMTHYMELMMGSLYLLVLFMAVPMFLAECYVVSEILLLLKPREGGALVAFNKLSAFASAAGIALLSAYAAFYFSQVTEWRTWIDVTAAAAYVAAGIPFIYVGLLEAGLIARNKASVWKGRSAVAAVVAYLIFSHAAMVFGMFDPMQFGWQPENGAHMMHDMAAMPADHSMHGMSGMDAPEGMHRMPDGTLMHNGHMMH